MFTKAFWRGAAERAVKTFLQVLAASVAVGGTDLASVGWKQALLTALGATVASVLTSAGSAPVSPAGSPSLVQDRP